MLSYLNIQRQNKGGAKKNKEGEKLKEWKTMRAEECSGGKSLSESVEPAERAVVVGGMAGTQYGCLHFN